MGSKKKKGFRESIDDVLDDLLGDDAKSPKISAFTTTQSGSAIRKSATAAPRTSKKSLLDDDFFNKLAQEAGKDNDESEISEVDHQALLETMENIDDMDADLFGKKKNPRSVPNQLDENPVEAVGSKPESSRTAQKPAEVKDMTGQDEKQHSSTTSSRHHYKKFTFDDVDDPLAGILSDEEEEPKKTAMSGQKPGLTNMVLPAHKKEEKVPSTPASIPVVTISEKKDELFFDDEGDDLMDALGFGDSPETSKLSKKVEDETLRSAHSKLDELFGLGTTKKLLERPTTGERNEFKLDPKYNKIQEKEDFLDDFAFGSYQPTVATTPEDRQSRRQSVRFSPESHRKSNIDQKSKTATPTSLTPTKSHGNKGAADWLGLKDDVVPDLDNQISTEEMQKESRFYKAKSDSNFPASQNQSKRPYSAGRPPSAPRPSEKALVRSAPSSSKTQMADVVEGDWLKEILSQKKSQLSESQPLTSADKVDGMAATCEQSGLPCSSGPSSVTAETEPIPEINPADSGSSFSKEISQKQAKPLVLSDSLKDSITKSTGVATSAQEQKEDKLPALQISMTTNQLQQLLQLQPLQSKSARQGSSVDALNAVALENKRTTLQKNLKSTDAEQQTALQIAEIKVIELESKVRKLELEREQQRILLESLQQQHKDDLELIEDAHRNRLKVIESSYQQQVARLQDENGDLSEQHVAWQQCQDRERSEQVARYQRKLNEFEEEKAKEKERLRELQRQSVAEMRRDHEEQLQHVKQLKEQEIDAVTSASSHARSLNTVIEQMEFFSGKLNDLSYKVESAHQSTSHEMEISARLRDEQQRAQQDRLLHQQRDLEEERARLQDVITKMEIRLNEQTRLLEKERWRATSEQTKVESVQRSLEEERRLMSQHFSIEREELERAKSALLGEQQSVMQRCAEERRRLAGEWTEFHTQQKLNNGRMERDTNRSLQLNAQQEGTIFSLAKEQAEIKVKVVELKSKEEQLAQEREVLNQERHELQLEKERVNAMAIRIKQRAEEVDNMSKLASQKYEEGEQAFMDAKRVESEHQARLHAIHLKMERLQQQEQQIHQERLNLVQQRHHSHTPAVKMPVNTLGPPIRNQMVSMVNHSYLPPVRSNAHQGTPWNSGSVQNIEKLVGSEASDIKAKLAIFKHVAEKDRDFLEDEQFFLETLKKAQYKVLPQTA
ncbi:fas-binding factor 1 homolog isoform X2 [Leucoraja erinacea]|uniref:fas-binding factor 1 homolog isoform X2 n=1 Tax=Leucoraja erinaceus TaxID=7782 RepID=UPI0024541A01|nr:fas-binding factor 1 homolog isoform X2 [Leucoraja erinacea]